MSAALLKSTLKVPSETVRFILISLLLLISQTVPLSARVVEELVAMCILGLDEVRTNRAITCERVSGPSLWHRRVAVDFNQRQNVLTVRGKAMALKRVRRFGETVGSCKCKAAGCSFEVERHGARRTSLCFASWLARRSAQH